MSSEDVGQTSYVLVSVADLQPDEGERKEMNAEECVGRFNL